MLRSQTGKGREVLLEVVPSWRDVFEVLSFARGDFLLFLVGDFSSSEEHTLSVVVDRATSAGCCCFVFWGKGCAEMEAVANLTLEVSGKASLVQTVSFASEDLDYATWFAVDEAKNQKGHAAAQTLAIAVEDVQNFNVIAEQLENF